MGLENDLPDWSTLRDALPYTNKFIVYDRHTVWFSHMDLRGTVVLADYVKQHARAVMVTDTADL